MAESSEQQANDIHDDYPVIYMQNGGASCSNVQSNGDYVVSNTDEESETETVSETETDESTGSTYNNKRSLWSIEEEAEEDDTKSILNGLAELEVEEPGTSDFSRSSTSGFCSTFDSNSEVEEVRQMLADLTVEGSAIEITDDSEVSEIQLSQVDLSESDNERENVDREFNELYNFTMVTNAENFFDDCLADEANVVNEPNAGNANNDGNDPTNVYDERFYFIDSSELYYSDDSEDSGTTISTDESDASD